ncbi:HNH endonuclease [Arthrobacter sp. IA7]|uniref:HNH endonuclease n=1 Tax=Arthrobacter ipis TaxID=2716202 RepID=UPI0016840284|nr:HNH endonuclease [Arthrobacter ipis]
MATSRTGTATWKRRRAHALREAQAHGRTHCPYCRCQLDYDLSLKPNSAEVDHVIPFGTLGHDNGPLDVICRACNQSKGNRAAPRAAGVLTRKPLSTSRKW